MNKIIIVDMKYYSNIICLTADSMVNTPSGELRIDCIKPGMEIVGYDIHSASYVYDTVYRTVRSLHDHCAKVVFDNGTSLVLTVDHPIYVENKGWCVACMSEDNCAYGVNVSQLIVGDLFRASQPTFFRVDSQARHQRGTHEDWHPDAP